MQPEQKRSLALLLLIPEGKSDVHTTMRVRDSGDAVLAPPKRSAPCHVVGEMTPSVAIFAVWQH